MENDKYPFENLPLPYDYNALEPYIDEKTMSLHHDRHLQTYINNLNTLLTKYPRLQKLPLEQLAAGNFNAPDEDMTAIKNNAGGVYNHRFFFCCLTPYKTRLHGRLLNAVEKQYKNTDAFFSEYKKAAMSVFGSGYAWLICDRGRLKIITTANQNVPLPRQVQPILCTDVWEHAYYLKHYNLRSDYIDDIFSVMNFDFAEESYKLCLKGKTYDNSSDRPRI